LQHCTSLHIPLCNVAKPNTKPKPKPKTSNTDPNHGQIPPIALSPRLKNFRRSLRSLYTRCRMSKTATASVNPEPPDRTQSGVAKATLIFDFQKVWLKPR